MNSGPNTAGILKDAKGRTTSTLALLQAAMERVRLQVEAGDLDEAFLKEGEKAVPSPNKLCVAAGLGPYFLYGPKHKDTTAEQVDEFRDEMLNKLQRRVATSGRSPTPSVPAEFEALKAKYQNLADETHLWHVRMRSMRYELRQLKKRHPPKLVSLTPKS